jgi:hypothetical protein
VGIVIPVERTKVIELLKVIIDMCPALKIDGFYLQAHRRAPKADMELVIITSLDTESRKKLESLLSTQGLVMEEKENIVTIYKPQIQLKYLDPLETIENSEAPK